jgi:general secretion pathway protein F
MSRSTGIRYDAKVPRTFTVPVFNYEAASKDGSLTRGAIEAPTRSLAVEKILGQGQTPIRVTEQAGGGAVRLLPALAMPTAMASTRTRVTLLQELSVLLKAGLTVERALATLVALSSNQRTRDLIESVLESLRGGEPLSGA